MTKFHAASWFNRAGHVPTLAFALATLSVVPLPTATAQAGLDEDAPAIPAARTLGKRDALEVEELNREIIELRSALKYEETIPLARRALAIRTRAQGQEHWETVDARVLVESLQKIVALGPKERADVNKTYDQIDEAHQLLVREKFADCLALLKRALEVRKERLGPDAPETLVCANNLAVVLNSLGEYREAQTYYEQAANGRRRLLGENHPGLASSYSNLADNLKELGRLKDALTYQEKALAILSRTVGPEADGVAQVRNSLGMLLDVLGRHAEARPHYEKALVIALRAQGEDSLEVIQVRGNLAVNLMHLGDYRGAEAAGRRVLAGYRAMFPEGHTEIAAAAMNLAVVLDHEGKYPEGEALLREALEIFTGIVSRGHPDSATCLNNLAANLSGQGRLAEAESLYCEALALTLAQFGERDSRVALLYNNLAEVLRGQGRVEETERYLRKALAIWTETRGDHEETANALNNLGLFLVDQRRFDDAEPLLQQALTLRRKLLGPTNPVTAAALNNLGGLFEPQGRFAEAERYHREAHAIRVALDSSSLGTAESCNNLAAVLTSPAQLEEKERLNREALRIREGRLTRDHELTGQSYNNLGHVLHARGLYAEAEAVWKTAAQIFESTRLRVGTSGLDRAQYSAERSPLLRLAALLAGSGKPEAAWEYWEANLARGLLDDLSTRQLRPLTTAQRQRETSLLGQLQQLEEQIGTLMAKGARVQEENTRLEDLRNQKSLLRGQFVALESELNAQYGAFDGKPASLDAVRAALPGDTALIGWVDLSFRGPHDRDRPTSHWACVVRGDSGPSWAPIPGTGPTQTWTEDDDRRPGLLRNALRNGSPAWRDLAAALAKQRLGPLQPHLSGTTHLIVLPSRALAGIPIDVLIEAQPSDAPRPTVSHAPSGTMFARLSRPRTEPARTTRLLALGDPAYPLPQREAPAPEPPAIGIAVLQVMAQGNADNVGIKAGDVLLEYNGHVLKSAADFRTVPVEEGLKRVPVKFWRNGEVRTVDVAAGPLGFRYQPRRTAAEVVLAHREAAAFQKSLTRGDSWERLPGTRREVEVIAGLFPEGAATTFLGEQANERAVQELAAAGKLKDFRFIHLAAHGRANPMVAMSSALYLAPDPARLAGLPALETDGRITAEQIVNTWDLDADLVGLSACETGLGKYAGGEGYLGFAQALFVKGARSVVLSQWKVPDTATSLLMTRFYGNLLGRRDGLAKPMTRAEALREAKTWLRGLNVERAEAEMKRLKLDPAATTRGETNLGPAAAESARPFEHPHNWAGFILIGDPS